MNRRVVAMAVVAASMAAISASPADESAGAAGTPAPGPARATPAAADGASPVAITEAERKIFLADHFAGMPLPGTLRYRYVRSGTLEPNWEDEVTVRVRHAQRDERAGGDAGARDDAGADRGVRSDADVTVAADVGFLTGSRRLELPAIDALRGNPVILYFLEQELREMHRLTRGSASYYRKRIRMALAGGPSLQPVKLQVGGSPRDCAQVRIDPYAGDPAADRFAAFTDRHYRFTLCDGLPGTVARLEAVLPGRGGASERLVDHLEWAGFEPGPR